jgi:hypothetical protein
MAADGPTGWVKILAGDYAATVSTRALLAQANSHLAQVIEPIAQTACAGAPACRVGCYFRAFKFLL